MTIKPPTVAMAALTLAALTLDWHPAVTAFCAVGLGVRIWAEGRHASRQESVS